VGPARGQGVVPDDHDPPIARRADRRARARPPRPPSSARTASRPGGLGPPCSHQWVSRTTSRTRSPTSRTTGRGTRPPAGARRRRLAQECLLAADGVPAVFSRDVPVVVAGMNTTVAPGAAPPRPARGAPLGSAGLRPSPPAGPGGRCCRRGRRRPTAGSGRPRGERGEDGILRARHARVADEEHAGVDGVRGGEEAAAARSARTARSGRLKTRPPRPCARPRREGAVARREPTQEAARGRGRGGPTPVR